ncbi:UV excision repair protein rad23 [Sorochytrium milnesiophthora]
MKIKVKTLQQKEYQLDVEPENSVCPDKIADVKKKIQEVQGSAPAQQKLIYSGKILTDDATIESLGVKENEFMVVMVTKPPAASSSTTSAPPATANTPASAPAPAAAPAASAPAASAPAPKPEPEQQPAAAAATASGAPTDPSFATGSAYATAVRNMEEMGFPREEVVRAMRAAFNNPDRAVEYLMTGIPNIDALPAGQQPAASQQPAQQQLQQQQQQQRQPAESTASGNLFEMAAQQAREQQQQHRQGANALNMNALAGLANGPHFEQLRQMIHADPQLIQPILQQLAATDPQLMQLINSNPQAFMNLLMGGAGGDEGMGEEGEEGGAAPGGLPPGAHVIEITEDEKAAVDRLCNLGFDRSQALEAYLACDKNEEMAANYLFENQEF